MSDQSPCSFALVKYSFPATLTMTLEFESVFPVSVGFTLLVKKTVELSSSTLASGFDVLIVTLSVMIFWLPAGSTAVIWKFDTPSANGFSTVIRHVPLSSAIADNVCPAIVSVTVLPASAFPIKVGTCLLVSLSADVSVSECPSRLTERLSS